MASTVPTTTGTRPSTTSIILIGLLIVAHIPFLLTYFKMLWELEHYQFFPFAIAALVWMVYERRDPQRYLWSSFCSLLVVLDLALIVLGVLMMSTWPIAAGLVCSTVALLWACREHNSRRTLLYLGLLPLILLRLPLNLDLRLIGWLQTKTTVAASALLHRLNYTHFRSGNVIEFADKSLLVEEACSGVQSLFTVMFLAVFFICRYRRSPGHSVILMLSAVFWAGLMNVVRVTGIAIAWKSFNLDLTTGWPHTAWGHVVLVLAILLLFSMDAFLESLTGFVPDVRADAERFRNPLTSLWNTVFGREPLPPEDPRSLDRPNRLAPGLLRSIPAMAIAALLLVAAQTTQAYVGSSGKSLALVSSLEYFSKTDLPETVGEWTQTGYTTKTRNLASSFGQYSNSWTYSRRNQPLSISCDHAFRGWHNLEVCYTGTGWVIDKREIIPLKTADGQDWHAVRVMFQRPTGETSVLYYSFFDAAGQIVQPPAASTGASLVDRILRRSALQFEGFNSATYQTQAFIETPGVPGQDQIDDILRQHELTRGLLREAYTKRR